MRYAHFGNDGRVVQTTFDVTVDEAPTGAIGITDEQYADVFSLLLVDGVLTVSPLPFIGVPRDRMELSVLQFELSLIHYNLLAPVLSVLATLPDEHPMRVYWRRTPTFHRMNPMVVAMATQLELTEEARDAVFTYTGT